MRINVLHHVTWSIDSICYTIHQGPFRTHRKATNVWPLAVLSSGQYRTT